MCLKQAELGTKRWRFSFSSAPSWSYGLYHRTVSGVGGLLVLWGLWQVYQGDFWLDFLLLLTLAFLATLTTSTVKL